MPPQNTAKSLMKEFRASFRRKKVTDATPKVDKEKQQEEEELAKLVELKETLGDDLPLDYTDNQLIGFLRARSLNVKEAAKLTKLDVCSRRFLQLDKFEPSELDLKYTFSAVLGFDKEGSLIRLINVGVGDCKGYVHSVSTVDELRTLLCLIQKDKATLEAENKRTGRNAHQFVYILNFEHLSFNQITYKPVLDTALLALKLFQDHENYLVKSVYNVNVPVFFSTLYKLFKPVMDENLIKRIKICDGGVDDFKGELLKIMDPDILPTYLGGNMADFGRELAVDEQKLLDSIIPESFYSEDFLDPDDPDVIVATIPAGSFINFRYAVSELGTTVRWHIQSKEYDLGFRIFSEPLTSGIETPRTQRKKAKEEDMSHMEPLTPAIRCQCHICPEVGSTVLWMTGTFVLHFDNTYSWMNAKEVLFKVKLEPPVELKKNYVNARINAIKAMERINIGK